MAETHTITLSLLRRLEGGEWAEWGGRKGSAQIAAHCSSWLFLLCMTQKEGNLGIKMASGLEVAPVGFLDGLSPSSSRILLFASDRQLRSITAGTGLWSVHPSIGHL